MLTTQDLLDKINKHIAQQGYGSNPPNLYEPIQYIMGLGGKRMRPLLVLLSYQLKGDSMDEILDAALAVEVFHNFTLVHDDIMDEAPLRRGQPTVHTKWNNTVAILSGDTMMIKAYELLQSGSGGQFSEVSQKFNQTAVAVCEGQQIDMNFEEQEKVTEKDYLEMIRLKTAVLLGFSMYLGGKLAGYNQASSEKLYSIGEKMGIGFQLMDDILDVYADKTKFGKQVGGDIISNKKTYLLLSALEMANSDQKDKLDHWLALKEFDPQEKVAAVTEIYDEIGIPNLAKMKMNYFFDQSIKELETFDGNSVAKLILKEFAVSLMLRDR